MLSKSALFIGCFSFMITNFSTAQNGVYSLQDYLKTNAELDSLVELTFLQMDDTARVAQLLMPAAGRLGEPNEKIESYIKKGLIGGVLLLNGSMDGFKKMVQDFNASNEKNGGLPFLYSADAEPSLVNRKISGSTVYKNANEIKTIEEVQKSARVISEDLKKIGINFNFAPVVDMPPNKTVGYRSMGTHEDSIVPWANEFIRISQELQIITTAKHFPGHGYVTGDTHQKLVFIDGELREIKNYPLLIENGVLSIMIAHIAVKNNETYNTDNQPASISRKIVTDLLRNQMEFQGLIVWDAMNMGGVSSVPNASRLAVEAGCDIVLMPLNVEKSHQEILTKYQSDENFKIQVDASVKRIIRMKMCLNLIHTEGKAESTE
jgi:beta-N-acetylhexosaminidase